MALTTLSELQAALAAAPEDEALRERTGEALLRAGNALGSLRVLSPQGTPDASWAPELRRAASAYLKEGRPEPAQQALRDAIELDPGDARLYEALAASYRQGEPPVPASTSPAPAKPEASAPIPEPADPIRVEAESTAAPVPLGSERRRAVASKRAAAAALALAFLCAALSLLRWALRGKGDLAVSIELPSERRGTFSVSLSRQRQRNRRPSATADPRNRASSRFEHNLIARETHFRGIPARSYWALVEGTIESDGDDRLNVREDREVRVDKGRTTKLVFDLRPRQCPVELRVVRSGRPVVEARVAVSGDPTSLRLARGGVLRMHLDAGSQALLIGAGDRAVEERLEIVDLTPRTVTVDLDDEIRLAFRDCAAAVEPFLRGDLSVVATALDRAGQKERADVVSAHFHQSRGSMGEAASRFEAAGRWLEAAELHGQMNDPARAAALFERGDAPERAAEFHLASGDVLRAGRAFEECENYEEAVRCYSDVDAPRLLDVLEKMGCSFDAGQLALRRGDKSRAVRNFQQVEARSAHYTDACRALASLFREDGRLELAVQKADEAISFSRPDETSEDTFAWYGDLLAEAGRPDRALRVFEELRGHAPDHPGVATRIEKLRKEISGQRRAASTGDGLSNGASRYEIAEEIGAGGMGIVLRARDKRLGREVALKRLPDTMKDHPRAVDLFLREARAAAALNHPNIVTVHDVDQEGGVFFITMELLVGMPLSELLRTRGKLTPGDVARLGVQATAGLAYAHSQGVIHRDIKTANLFLTEDRTVKIMDFGLAKMTEEVRRATTVVGGTPYYMAPEQAAGQTVDHRADLYSFGVTLFELATGRRPFEEGDVTYHHRHTSPPDPRARIPDIPTALAELILRLLAKNPAERPASADEAGRVLQRIAMNPTR